MLSTVMNAPATPKIQNGTKRPIPTNDVERAESIHAIEDEDTEDCCHSMDTTTPDTNITSTAGLRQRHDINDDWFMDCQRSLKRLKVTSLSGSPGELRLQRDFKHAVHCEGWIPRSGGGWLIPYTDDHAATNRSTTGSPTARSSSFWLTLQQSPDDPLHLIFELPLGLATLWLQVPRFYPHRPPEIRRIIQSSSSSLPQDTMAVHISSSPDDAAAAAANSATQVVVLGWSPVQRLDEILVLLVQLWQPSWRPAAAARNTTTTTTTTTTVLSEQQQNQWKPPPPGDFFCPSSSSSSFGWNNDQRQVVAASSISRQKWSEADCATELQKEQPPKHNQYTVVDDDTAPLPEAFPPNRFNVGYPLRLPRRIPVARDEEDGMQE
jgi:hypothetical protein